MPEDLYARVKRVRQHLRGEDPLPDWTPAQWLMAINIKLGDAAYLLHPHLYEAHGLTAANRADGVECLVALAAAALDAIDAIEAIEAIEQQDDDRR